MEKELVKYGKFMKRLRQLREKSIDNLEALMEYNQILESPEFQELEDKLINYATDK